MLTIQIVQEDCSETKLKPLNSTQTQLNHDGIIHKAIHWATDSD